MALTCVADKLSICAVDNFVNRFKSMPCTCVVVNAFIWLVVNAVIWFDAKVFICCTDRPATWVPVNIGNMSVPMALSWLVDKAVIKEALIEFKVSCWSRVITAELIEVIWLPVRDTACEEVNAPT